MTPSDKVIDITFIICHQNMCQISASDWK